MYYERGVVVRMSLPAARGREVRAWWALKLEHGSLRWWEVLPHAREDRGGGLSASAHVPRGGQIVACVREEREEVWGETWLQFTAERGAQMTRYIPLRVGGVVLRFEATGASPVHLVEQ